MITVAAFDLDGTLTQYDTMHHLLRQVHGTWGYRWRVLKVAFTLLRWKLGLMDRTRAKSVFLRHMLQDVSAEVLTTQVQHMAADSHLLHAEMVAQLQQHMALGHHCIIVSASLDIWVQPIAKRLGVEAISTRASWDMEAGFTGIEGQNCYGEEKVRRLTAHMTAEAITKSYAYGDSAGDAALIQWADVGVWVKDELPKLDIEQ